MAFHKIEILDNSNTIAPASNRGVGYGDFKLYLFGGYSSSEISDSLQIFNLKTNTWESFTELSKSLRPSRRHLHFSLFLPPNYFFIYGGSYKEHIYNDTYLFNTLTYNWEKATESDTNPGNRYGCCGGIIGSIIFLLGGFGVDVSLHTEKNLDDVWCFDYRSREWAIFNTIGEERVEGIDWTCVVVNKQLFCLGSNLYKMCVLTTTTREWKTLSLSGAIPAKLERFTFTKNDSGLFFLFGGSGYTSVSQDIFALEQHENNYIWHKLESTGNIPSPRYSHSTIALGETLLIIGGRNGEEYFNDMYAFNPNLGLRWLSLTAYGEIPEDRVGHISFYVEEIDSIVIHGGDCRGIVTNDMYLFKYKLREWALAEFEGDSPSLAYHSCVHDSLHKQLLIYGGGNLSECFSDIYTLSLPDLIWSCIKIKKSIGPRAGHSAFLHPKKNLMLVFGGFVPIEGYSNELWSFDIIEHKWNLILTSTVAGGMPIGRISSTFTLYGTHAYMIGGINSEVVLDDLWKLNLETFIWERITIFEKSPGRMYGHSATLVGHHIFIYTGDCTNNNGELISVPTIGLLWSLNLSDNLEWSRYKVEGNITPKRFHTATLVTNDIIIYGGGPDNTVYQLDRNDVPDNAVSCDIFQDFILPYVPIVEKHLGNRKKEKLLKMVSQVSSANSESKEIEEEKIQVFGHQDLQKKKTGSSTASKADDVMHKAELVALARKGKKIV